MMETMEGLPCPRSPVSAEVEDWADDMGLEDVESDGDESDEDLLCNKLCTYVQTQKEFMNQVFTYFFKFIINIFKCFPLFSNSALVSLSHLPDGGWRWSLLRLR